jgi:hypothetical protein
MNKAALAVALAAVISVARRADAYTVVGSGTGSCGAWAAHHRAFYPGAPPTDDAQSFLGDMQWVFGFLSGIGFSSVNGDDPAAGVEGERIIAWIDNYCQAHPLDKLRQAAAAFDTAHQHKRRDRARGHHP